LIVVEDAVSAESAERLKQYVSAGGRLLMVLADEQRAAGMVAGVNNLLGTQLEVSEAKIDDYAMLSKIDFRSAVFAAMSDPKFNDFTKVRFWSHRTISGLTFADREDRVEVNAEDQVDVADQVEVEPTQTSATKATLLASFDDGDPAFVQWDVGEGQLLLLAAGWQPEESQLALSTKFIPLVFSLFESGWAGRDAGGYALGDPLPFSPAENATITDPAGIETAFRTSADLDSISQPGVYQFRDGDVQQRFAVNLQESESHTETLGDEIFERFDVVLGKTETTAQSLSNQRQLRDLELESRQRLWQWLLLAALGLIGLETWWGARLSRRREVSQPTAT
jgi:hypothetical protein